MHNHKNNSKIFKQISEKNIENKNYYNGYFKAGNLIFLNSYVKNKENAIKDQINNSLKNINKKFKQNHPIKK